MGSSIWLHPVLTSLLFFLSFSSSSSLQLCPHDQSSALLQLRGTFSINCSASSDSCSRYYAKTISWKKGTDCCLWDGVDCDAQSGNVIGLDLSCSCLHGTIHSNSSLFLLHHVYKLNLAYNNFSLSQISSEFGQFTSLTHLNISDSGFSGLVSSVVPQLSRLVSLDLSYNYELRFDRNTFEKLLGNLISLRGLFLDEVNLSSIATSSFLNLSSSITSLSLEDSGLKGKFPDGVLHFPHLQKLSLSNNWNLIVNFPKTNWSSSLRSLELGSTNISGEIPDWIGNLRSLEVLDLSHCQLKGSIPTSLGNLSKLSTLDLSSNNLQGQIPDAFGNLTRLFDLDLASNYFSGQFPSFVFNLTQLEFLDISENNLVGSLPYQATGLSLLQSLRLGYNFITGRIPSWLFSLPSLVRLELTNNEFTGPIDQFEKPGPLVEVSLENNKIHGSIPSSIFELMNLTVLDLSYNNQLSFSNFSGANCRMPNLRLLDLSSCNISGFPDFIRNLDGLETLYLSHNQISMIDQSMLLTLKNLTSLDLSYNSQLSFSNFSGAYCRLPNLMSLYLSSCNISGFSDFIRNLDGLETLDLSYNQIPVIDQGMFLRLENLTYLDLSHNLLTNLDHHPWKNLQFLNLRSNLLQGPVLVPPPSIQYFLVSKNNLTGEIPSLICNLSSLEILDLSDNNLSGTIPTCPGLFSNYLRVLDLQNNSFHGSIPDSFAKENKLESLNLNGNDFDGPLPQSLVNCSSLAVLNLGNNRLNNTFPYWLGTLPELQVLILCSNNFHGPIGKPKTESPFPKLRILDLSHNKFSGFLPTTYFKSFKSMMNLDNMEVGYIGDRYHQDSVVVSMKGSKFKLERILTIFTTIDLSSNQFKGKISDRVGGLTSLQVLNFSHNSLSGSIPASMGKLAAIESLDLSSNKLVGEIPNQLTNLNFLEVLNLSQNQLSGPIPQGNQFNTFPNDSYSDNLGLCGFPLSKRCSENETPAFQEEDDHSASRFEWKGVMMGYGCSLVFGLSAGYIIFTIGKPGWLVRMVERAGNKLKKYHWSIKKNW